MGVDEPGQQAAAGQHDLVVGEGCRKRSPRARVRDATGRIDGERAVGLGDERVGRAVERGLPAT